MQKRKGPRADKRTPLKMSPSQFGGRRAQSHGFPQIANKSTENPTLKQSISDQNSKAYKYILSQDGGNFYNFDFQNRSYME